MTISIERFFYDHPVFRQEEFANLKKKQGVTNLPSIRQALHYYLKTKRIIAIRRMLYAVVPPTFTLENLPVDSYLIAAKATSDSILAYHTALELHGHAYSVFHQYTFVTNQKIKPFGYKDSWYKPVATPKMLKKNKAENYGIEIINRAGLNIKITNLARTYVDLLARIDLSGGWEEVYRGISNIAVLNVEEVLEYCLKLENSVTTAKVGFFLEQRKGAFAVDEKILQSLAVKKPKSPHYLIKSKQEGSEFVKRWNLIIPKSILYQTWEEPFNDNV